MHEVSFADGFDQPDVVAFGLGASQLIAVACGAALTWLVLHSTLPAPLRLPVAGVVAALTAALGWGRCAGMPLLTWARLALRFGLRARSGGPDGSHGDAAGHPPSPAPAEHPVPGPDRPAGHEPPRHEWAGPDQEGEEPQQAWTRWLRRSPGEAGGRSRTPLGDAPGEAPGPASGELSAPAGGRDRPDASIPSSAARERDAAGSSTPTRSPAGAGSARAGTPHSAGAGAPATASGDLEIRRPRPVVVLPEAPSPAAKPDRAAGAAGPATAGAPPAPVTAGPDRTGGAGTGGGDGDPEDGDDLPDPFDDGVIQLPRTPPSWETDDPAAAAPLPAPPPGPSPVFVGATRRVTFFSLNGGSGRTTLATEVAALLAGRGRHSEQPDGPPVPLRVALLDLDLRSASVAVRLGIPQPTLWDYLLDGEPDHLDRYMVRHGSGLRALLGPPKPLTGQAAVEPARIAEIVHQLEVQGTHFIVIDLGADMGAVTTWVLSAVHDIFVVITPSAQGVQDAYRSTEALRRLGLGHKLRYVVNRARGPVDMDEHMADLQGQLVATIPYDPRVEEAENRHRCVALDGAGAAAQAITALAARLYPALAPPRRSRRIPLFRRRRAG